MLPEFPATPLPCEKIHPFHFVPLFAKQTTSWRASQNDRRSIRSGIDLDQTRSAGAPIPADAKAYFDQESLDEQGQLAVR
jgi:hypothetical protein